MNAPADPLLFDPLMQQTRPASEIAAGYAKYAHEERAAPWIWGHQDLDNRVRVLFFSYPCHSMQANALRHLQLYFDRGGGRQLAVASFPEHPVNGGPQATAVIAEDTAGNMQAFLGFAVDDEIDRCDFCRSLAAALARREWAGR